MPKFIASALRIAQSIIQPEGNDIASCLEVTNDSGELRIDPLTGNIVAICDNKPVDKPVFNIYWEEEHIH